MVTPDGDLSLNGMARAMVRIPEEGADLDNNAGTQQ